MKTILTYNHTRSLFKGSEFKSFVHQYFEDVEYLGTECGNYSPSISISNWEDIKSSLPKYAIPVRIKLDDNNIGFIEALANGQLGLAREKCGNPNSPLGYYAARKWDYK